MSTPSKVRLRDPLTEVTRKERRTLLAIAALGILMVKTGLIPSKNSALGIEFSPGDQKVILHALAVLIGYFLVGFFIYASTDFILWRQEFHTAIIDQGRPPRRSGTSDPNEEIFESDLSKRSAGRLLFYRRLGKGGRLILRWR